MIDKEETKRLSKLSRIYISDKELDKITLDLEQIIEFVSQLDKEAFKDGSIEPSLAHKNVMRGDQETHESGIYTKDILALAPYSDGKFLRVDKIIKE